MTLTRRTARPALAVIALLSLGAAAAGCGKTTHGSGTGPLPSTPAAVTTLAPAGSATTTGPSSGSGSTNPFSGGSGQSNATTQNSSAASAAAAQQLAAVESDDQTASNATNQSDHDFNAATSAATQNDQP